MNFHIFHNGNAGKQFICKYSQGSGFTELPGGDCDFVKEQIRVLNKGFAGVKQDEQPTEYNDDTKFQFCLVGANDVRPKAEYDNASFYGETGNYKATFRTGEMETLNVWVNKPRLGYFGYASWPTSNFGTDDGVVILNEVVS